MLIKSLLLILVTFFGSFGALADQKGLGLLNKAKSPQAQVEWFVDAQQGSQWSFNLKGLAEQLVGSQAKLSGYRSRVMDRATGKAVIDWQGTDDLAFDADQAIYFLLTTGDHQAIAQLVNPSETLELQIEYKSLHGKKIHKNYSHSISLKEFCEAQPDRVVQPFTGEVGCHAQLSQSQVTGRCTAAEQDTFCNSAFKEKRQSIEQRLGCQLICR